jgi:SAM-dependent methyltransferase
METVTMDYDIAAYGDRRTNYDELDWARRHDEEEASGFLARLAPGGRALELGIGTGRVALPLARRGLKVFGVEASRSMAEQLERKLADEAVITKIGDFADLQHDSDFNLIYCVSETFFLLPTQEKQLRCVENAATHLAAGGRFVVQVTVPDHDLYCKSQRTTTRQVDEKSVTVSMTRHYRTEQRVDVQNIVIRKKCNEFYPTVYRYVWPSELDLMARIAGLRLLARFDGWRDEPYTASGGYVSVYGRL